jgi:hypothetical protein
MKVGAGLTLDYSHDGLVYLRLRIFCFFVCLRRKKGGLDKVLNIVNFEFLYVC